MIYKYTCRREGAKTRETTTGRRERGTENKVAVVLDQRKKKVYDPESHGFLGPMGKKRCLLMHNVRTCMYV